ncbi:MAG TPA: hypothetical protein VE085_13800 [Burkholderiales bacterium]|nr:hypothetical protein [Burkholderiales bacterium]
MRRFRALAVFALLLRAAPCGAQDLPDPGRRLSDQEQHADPDKRTPQKQSGPFDPSPVPKRNAQACEGARKNYQMSCRAVGSFASHSQACAEAYAIYRQNCP